MKKESCISVPGGEKEVLLHTCCAPCSSAIVECMMNNGIRPVIFYCNPNIYPVMNKDKWLNLKFTSSISKNMMMNKNFNFIGKFKTVSIISWISILAL